MSSLVVKVCLVDAVRSHPNADLLEIAEVNGWQCVVSKGTYQPGQLCVYFPPDTLIPRALADSLNITRYLSWHKDEELGRIRCAKLRGEPSFGLVISAPEDYALGADVAGYYGAEKYTPPPRFSAGDAEVEHPLFGHFTEIENLRNFPDVLCPGELVSVSEKLHGTQCRVGIIEGQLMAGSHKYRRREPADYSANTYWLPLAHAGVCRLLDIAGQSHRQVILFGEVYGRGIQNYDYGTKAPTFAIFDILVDGRYLPVSEFRSLCQEYDVPVVPLLYEGSFYIEKIRELSVGPACSGKHIREGVVVRSVRECTDPRIGRVVLKYASDAYLLGQREDFTDA